MAFLPMNAKEMRDRGWNEVDFVYVCGDSYVDHPSFGAAIITRVLEDCGYKIAFLAQPNWKNDDDFTQFGKPRLGFMVSAGNIDSMVAHYTVANLLSDASRPPIIMGESGYSFLIMLQ